MSANIEKYNRKGVRTSYISTIIGISLVLFTIGLVIGGVLYLDNIQTKAKEDLQTDIFFKPEFNEADIKQIAQELKSWKEIREVIYVTPERAIEEVSSGDESAAEILEILDGENPFPPTITFRPVAKYATLDGMQNLKDKLELTYPDQIDDVNYNAASVSKVNLGFAQFIFLAGIVALLLIIVAIAMINNTIRLALYSKRFTIKTMQLVGATHKFIRSPFLRQSVWQGVVSAIIGMALIMSLIFALNNVTKTIDISFELIHLIILSGSLLILGIIITFISTWVALNKYLRMKLDDLY